MNINEDSKILFTRELKWGNKLYKDHDEDLLTANGKENKFNHEGNGN